MAMTTPLLNVSNAPLRLNDRLTKNAGRNLQRGDARASENDGAALLLAGDEFASALARDPDDVVALTGLGAFEISLLNVLLVRRLHAALIA